MSEIVKDNKMTLLISETRQIEMETQMRGDMIVCNTDDSLQVSKLDCRFVYYAKLITLDYKDNGVVVG